MNDRITNLEELLAHQQRLLDDLNAVVTMQRDEIDALSADHARLRVTVQRLVQHHEGAEDQPDERPPHY